ncbi:MAG TPA: bacterial transcriptional activator domain-containing protein [Stellaceae bacterium]|nr:bacterial transcriptional activator domain-containing protein [Stellaceae bacterium]
MKTESIPISLSLLGPFGMRVDGRYCLPLPRKAQALIALMALHPELALPREVAVEMIWGGLDGGQDGYGLRQTLDVIRRQTGCNLVRLSRGMLSLMRDGVTIDAVQFQVLAGSRDRCELGRCAALYRGELLENVATVAPGFDEWLAVERIRLAEIAAETMRRVALSQLDVGEFDAAVATARRVVALDEFRLDAHGLLVSILGGCGRQVEAVRHSEFCARVLRDRDAAAPAHELLAPFLARRAGGRRSGASEPSLAPQPSRSRR